MCRKGDFLEGAISLFCLPDLLTLLGLICEVKRQEGLSCRVAILAFVHLFSFLNQMYRVVGHSNTMQPALLTY